MATLLRLLLPAMLLGLSPAAKAQLLDTIGGFLSQRPKVLLTLDSRGSFISNRNVSFWGAKVGLEHAGRVRYGLGYSLLATHVDGAPQADDLDPEGRLPTRFRMGYVSPFFSFTFFKRGHWEAAIPVQVGLGSGSVSRTDEAGKRHTLAKGFVFLYEPCMTVQYRFLRYFAVGLGWGYRLVFTPAELGQRLTAPIYLYGIKVYLGELVRDLQGGG